MKENILKLFAFHKGLKFAQMEKELDIRSNKLAYHLKQLTKEGILAKKQDSYELTPKTEFNLPFLASSICAIPVILIHIGTSSKALLVHRKKRPYQNMLGMPGGRLLPGESIQDAAQRIVQKKCNISIKKPKVSQIALEHIKKSNQTICSFLLIMVKAETENSDKLIPVRKNKSQIIPSDYALLTRRNSKSFKIQTLIGKEE